MNLWERTGSLRGRFVELVPLDAGQAGELAAAAAIDRSTYGFTEVPADPDAMAGYIERMLALRDAGVTVPFAQRLADSGRYVGCTRFHEFRYWRGRPDPDEAEIGGTWLAADVQRTPVNTESKLLMLSHAFATWGVWRVAIVTDERNARSRAAIERVGARYEGIMRNHRLSTHPGETGQPRQTAVYSITPEDWPDVKSRLEARLAGASPASARTDNRP